MAITTVLFDLDGTLLPMDLDTFIKAYFGAIAKRIVDIVGSFCGIVVLSPLLNISITRNVARPYITT